MTKRGAAWQTKTCPCRKLSLREQEGNMMQQLRWALTLINSKDLDTVITKDSCTMLLTNNHTKTFYLIQFHFSHKWIWISGSENTAMVFVLQLLISLSEHQPFNPVQLQGELFIYATLQTPHRSVPSAIIWHATSQNFTKLTQTTLAVIGPLGSFAVLVLQHLLYFCTAVISVSATSSPKASTLYQQELIIVCSTLKKNPFTAVEKKFNIAPQKPYHQPVDCDTDTEV